MILTFVGQVKQIISFIDSFVKMDRDLFPLMPPIHLTCCMIQCIDPPPADAVPYAICSPLSMI